MLWKIKCTTEKQVRSPSKKRKIVWGWTQKNLLWNWMVRGAAEARACFRRARTSSTSEKLGSDKLLPLIQKSLRARGDVGRDSRKHSNPNYSPVLCCASSEPLWAHLLSCQTLRLSTVAPTPLVNLNEDLVQEKPNLENGSGVLENIHIYWIFISMDT